MDLETYNAKRRFDRTPEPKGEKATESGSQFIVQKHDATRLHYDFRLEMDGVLKSWAVTRGPSLDPEDKRLAVHVEDHPLSYGSFEGIIPKGEYGAGTVILWDRGQWQPIGDAKKGYKKGHLEFELEGEKLKGRWHLVRMKGKEGEKRENWLLIKGDDDEARHGDGDALLTEQAASVVSGKEIAAMAENPDARWEDGKKQPATPTKSKANKKAAKKVSGNTQEWPKGSRKKAMPEFIEPALATLKPQPPKGDKWLHEIKFDGYRLQVRIEGSNVEFRTRSGLDWTEKFGTRLKNAFAALPVETALIDGEVVVERDNGASDFSALQEDLSEGRDDRFTFYAFDLLHLDGHDLTQAALEDRKGRLAELLSGVKPPLRYSAHFSEAGGLVLEHACRLSLEGVISKDATSKYKSGRGRVWIKSKCSERQEFVIGGYASSSTSDQAIGSLALGVYEDGKLRHVGRVGTGFTVATAEKLFKLLDPLSQDKSAFSSSLTADAKRNLVFVKPELIAEVEFRAWSGDGNLRHASFRGLREDKAPEEVRRETSETSETSEAKDKDRAPKSRIKFTHPDRVYWPDAGVTKEGLGEYYAQVWKMMAPFVVDRPLALLRCPEGISGQTFFQKHAWRGMNKNVKELRDPKDKDGKGFLKITDFEGMMALVQSGVLEIHPWGASARSLEKPDMITMDLDPGDDVAWADVIAGAQELKKRIEDAGLVSFVKTSGGKGLHVVIPLKPEASWTKVKAFAKALAVDMSKAEPDRYLAVATKAKRTGKIYVDYLRNGRGNTAVAPYSTRARPGAAISMPLDWSELTEEIGPDYFTVDTIGPRLAALKSDPWEKFFASAKPLP